MIPLNITPKCSLCNEDSIGSMGIPLIAKTESGKTINAFQNKDMALQIPIPLCSEHFPCAIEGLIFTDGKTITFLGQLNFEKFKNAEELEIKEAMEDSKNNPELSVGYHVLRAIIEGRKMKQVMQKYSKN